MVELMCFEFFLFSSLTEMVSRRQTAWRSQTHCRNGAAATLPVDGTPATARKPWQRSKNEEKGVGSAVLLLPDVDDLCLLRFSTVAQGGRRCQSWHLFDWVAKTRLNALMQKVCGEKLLRTLVGASAVRAFPFSLASEAFFLLSPKL